MPNWWDILGKVGTVGSLGAGILGNVSSGRRESQFSGTLLDLLKRYVNLTPEQTAAMMQQFQQPMSQALQNTILRQVQASMGERGLADAPGLIAEATAQALGPYQFAEQQLSAQNLFDMLKLPLGVQSPQFRQADLSGLARLLADWGGSTGVKGMGADQIRAAVSRLLKGIGGGTAAGTAAGAIPGIAELPVSALNPNLSALLPSLAGGGAAAGVAGLGAGIAELPLPGVNANLAALLPSIGGTAAEAATGISDIFSGSAEALGGAAGTAGGASSLLGNILPFAAPAVAIYTLINALRNPHSSWAKSFVGGSLSTNAQTLISHYNSQASRLTPYSLYKPILEGAKTRLETFKNSLSTKAYDWLDEGTRNQLMGEVQKAYDNLLQKVYATSPKMYAKYATSALPSATQLIKSGGEPWAV